MLFWKISFSQKVTLLKKLRWSNWFEKGTLVWKCLYSFIPNSFCIKKVCVPKSTCPKDLLHQCSRRSCSVEVLLWKSSHCDVEVVTLKKCEEAVSCPEKVATYSRRKIAIWKKSQIKLVIIFNRNYFPREAPFLP